MITSKTAKVLDVKFAKIFANSDFFKCPPYIVVMKRETPRLFYRMGRSLEDFFCQIRSRRLCVSTPSLTSSKLREPFYKKGRTLEEDRKWTNAIAFAWCWNDALPKGLFISERLWKHSPWNVFTSSNLSEIIYRKVNSMIQDRVLPTFTFDLSSRTTFVVRRFEPGLVCGMHTPKALGK